MRAFVTGGTGFVGGHLVRKLRERGDEVVALVRSPSKATQVRELGCEIVEGDLGDEEVIQKGAPVVIVQPGGIYGPGDPSILGIMMRLIRKGMMPFNIMPKAGFNWVYVEDVADGILLAHDKGRTGESYVLGGQIENLKTAI